LDMKRIEIGENLTTEFKREYTEEIKKQSLPLSILSGERSTSASMMINP